MPAISSSAWNVVTPNALVLAELVEDVGGRGDRVGAEEQRQPGLHAAGDQAVGQREVAGDVAVGAGRHRRRLDLVLRPRTPRWSRRSSSPRVNAVTLASRMSGALAKRSRRNAIVDSVGPAVHPRQQAEREHVLRAGGVLAGQPELLDRLDRHPVRSSGVHGVLGEASRPRAGSRRSRPWSGCAR